MGFGVDWKPVDFHSTNCSQGLVAETLSQKLCPIKLNGDTLECVDKFCYLGDMIGSGGGAEDASSMRVNVHGESLGNSHLSSLQGGLR